MISTAEATSVSLLPPEEHRPVEIRALVLVLADGIDRSRSGYATVAEVVAIFLEAHGIELPRGHSSESVAAEITALLHADTVYDSELKQAQRASRAVLERIFGADRVRAKGWLAGEQIVLRGERFELTGDVCPSCGINPEAYGIGGGVRCVDRNGCRWSFCY